MTRLRCVLVSNGNASTVFHSVSAPNVSHSYGIGGCGCVLCDVLWLNAIVPVRHLMCCDVCCAHSQIYHVSKTQYFRSTWCRYWMFVHAENVYCIHLHYIWCATNTRYHSLCLYVIAFVFQFQHDHARPAHVFQNFRSHVPLALYMCVCGGLWALGLECVCVVSFFSFGKHPEYIKINKLLLLLLPFRPCSVYVNI